jgi:hypothetical protein
VFVLPEVHGLSFVFVDSIGYFISWRVCIVVAVVTVIAQSNHEHQANTARTSSFHSPTPTGVFEFVSKIGLVFGKAALAYSCLRAGCEARRNVVDHLLVAQTTSRNKGRTPFFVERQQVANGGDAVGHKHFAVEIVCIEDVTHTGLLYLNQSLWRVGSDD